MGAKIQGVWRPTADDAPLYRGSSTWKEQVPPGWWDAYYVLLEHGIPTKLNGWPPPWTPGAGPPPENVNPEAHKSILSKVYMFAMWASVEDTAFKWRGSDNKLHWFKFDGGVSIVDVRRRWEDYGTSWAPRLSELRKAGMLYVIDRRPDPITGKMSDVLKPTGRVIPLPKPPSFQQTATRAIKACRKIVEAMPAESPARHKLHAALHTPGLEYILDGMINGQKVI